MNLILMSYSNASQAPADRRLVQIIIIKFQNLAVQKQFDRGKKTPRFCQSKIQFNIGACLARNQLIMNEHVIEIMAQNERQRCQAVQ